MGTQVTWLGHATWLIETAKGRILVDPFLADNPAAACKPEEVDADIILITHGHADHIADAASIANRCNATVYANFEIATWLANTQGVKNTVGMNLGGSASTPMGRVKMTIAHHSSQLPDGQYGGNPGGFVLYLDNETIYIAGDTALFLDMQLIGRDKIDLAILPIGDLYTMGPEDSIHAIEMLKPKSVMPSHYNTWPPIAQDAVDWGAKVESRCQCRAIVPKAGQAVEI